MAPAVGNEKAGVSENEIQTLRDNTLMMTRVVDRFIKLYCLSTDGLLHDIVDIFSCIAKYWLPTFN